jgi:hypothetical protein
VVEQYPGSPVAAKAQYGIGDALYNQGKLREAEAAYRAVLEQLDAAPSWTAASQIIAREVFRKHHVNIYSDAAVAFTDAAEARFTRQ